MTKTAVDVSVYVLYKETILINRGSDTKIVTEVDKFFGSGILSYSNQ